MMEWYLYVIIILSIYVLSVIIKAIIFYKEMQRTPITDYKTILEFLSITLGIIKNIVMPLFIFRYLKEVHDRNKQRERLAQAAITDYLEHKGEKE